MLSSQAQSATLELHVIPTHPTLGTMEVVLHNSGTDYVYLARYACYVLHDALQSSTLPQSTSMHRRSLFRPVFQKKSLEPGCFVMICRYCTWYIACKTRTAAHARHGFPRRHLPLGPPDPPIPPRNNRLKSQRLQRALPIQCRVIRDVSQDIKKLYGT